MRILLHTRFPPSVGGIETLAWLLAREWHRSGHLSTVVSDVSCGPESRPQASFPLFYRPGPVTWLKLLRRCEIVVHFNISLRCLWPLLLVKRPFVPVHHGMYVCDCNGRRDWRESIKVAVARRCNVNIAASRAIARAVAPNCDVVPNAYDDSLFKVARSNSRRRDVIVVGRLVSDKGVDLVLVALSRLRRAGVAPRLTIVGDGPERPRLERLAAEHALKDQVRFTGLLRASEVAAELQRHCVLVVPSLWEEPFGIVALEGAACGCVVLGSDGGGLPEAIGPCGITFRRGDWMDLSEKLQLLLTSPDMLEAHRSAAAGHLERHRPAEVAAQYLQVFRRALQ